MGGGEEGSNEIKKKRQTNEGGSLQLSLRQVYFELRADTRGASEKQRARGRGGGGCQRPVPTPREPPPDCLAA